MQQDITIIGAGAAGLFCAGLLGQQGFDVSVIDNGKKLGRKILMSGGGRCNFTNMTVEASNYVSSNPHFCKSALSRFTQWDFLALVNQYQIAYHERDHGQLFCDNSAQDIVNLLQSECQKGNVKFQLQTELQQINQKDNGFELITSRGTFNSHRVIIATGGLSMPALGMTSIGYKTAEQFNLPVVPVRAGLVPLTLHKPLLDILSPLSGTAIMTQVSTVSGVTFKENLLFTHRGLSGPVILQISNYWQSGEAISINLLPNTQLEQFFADQRESSAGQSLKNILSKLLPKRLVECLIQLEHIPDIPLKQLNIPQQKAVIETLTNWQITPNGTEGYRTAEVTLGGIDTDVLSSKTMEVKKIPGLYFIGEVMDVSGWLGGYNFQWAWSSAWACADAIIQSK
ncbi:BaiN/RdsA family NAD(P)/FAD-dependent oxidoreductase [Zophobihabitans entericus]|uniref:NAD(P)/FAD-dependent oxidoreductase n=1 Tax=Zophobihabitans entericus TaxID=1635327 RepID=A0A6G9IBA4_9GAMM|nr:NAD(P)/FAD-dependent oxidoreductase [Zophobihabitans entericus]QIQ21515.1 NAD(P)/FAD-dependent oxidoreductase [Zophobihabitans entericus]